MPYDRKTIRTEAMTNFNHFSTRIRQVIYELIKNYCVPATCNIWIDDNLKRFYPDFLAFWTNDEFKLSHCLLRCKYFLEDNRTSTHIWQEIKSIFEAFDLFFGGVQIVFDQGSNMVAAFRITEEVHITGMAHRCHTALRTVWNGEGARNSAFAMFNIAIRAFRKYANQVNDIQNKSPKTLKGGSVTRSW